MAVKVNGNRGLNFVGSFDISEIEANAKRVMRLLADVRKQTENTSVPKPGASEDSYRQQQLAIQKALGDSRIALQELKKEQQLQRNELEKSRAYSAACREEVDYLKIAEQKLTNEYKQGKIVLAEYAFAQKKVSDAQIIATRTQKEADRAVREQLRIQKEQEALAERRRKKLELESSEYYKLTKALGTVRKEAKDVLAEMFRLEREGLKTSDAYRQLEIRSKALSAQTNILDKGVKQIDASLGLHQRNVGNYSGALESLSPQFAAINQRLGLFGTSLDALAAQPSPFAALGASLMAFGKAAMAFMLTPIGLIVTALAGMYALISSNKKVVVEFDAGLKGVQKTTNISGKELEKFGDSIISLSNSLKSISTKQLLEYAQVAGQLGVKGSANILRFTETLAKLEIASNISGEEGASSIARLLTLTDGGVQNVGAFGDEIVHLGNNFAATEKEILHNAERIAQNTGLYKIGRQSVLAYATATKAVGIEAELVGSSFGRVLGEMEKSIRTGKNVETWAAVTGQSVEQLKKNFKENSSGVFNSFIKGLNGVAASGGSVQGILEQVGIDAIREKAVIASLATNGYDVLTDALDKSATAAGALGTEFETANSKLENVGKRIGIAWDNLVLSFENGQGIIAKTGAYLGNTFADILVNLKDGIDELGVAFAVEKQYADDFMTSIETSRDANYQYADSLSGLITLFKEFSLEGFVKIFKVDIPNSLNTGGAYFDVFTNTIRGFIKFLSVAGPEIGKYLKNALNPFAKADSSGIDALYNNFKNTVKQQNDFIINDTKRVNVENERLFKERYEAARNNIIAGEAAAANNKAGLTEEQKRQINQIEEQKKAEFKANNQRLEAQRALQAKIDDINNTAHRKQHSRDEEEIQAIRDKYAKIRQEVDAFYKNPKNKGLKIDVSGLSKSERLEIDTATAKQETAALLVQLEEQKKLFAEYEEYRKDFGIEKANERYRGELEGFKTYLSRLKSERDQLTNKGSDLTGPEAERLKEVEDRIKQEELLEQKKYLELLKTLKTYEQERSLIIEDYQSKRQQLLQNGAIDEVEQLDKIHKKALAAFDDAEVKRTDLYKEATEKIVNFTEQAVKEQIAKNKLLLKDERISAELRAELVENIKELEKDLAEFKKKNLVEGLAVMAATLRESAGLMAKFDQETAKAANTVANLVEGIAGIAGGLASGNPLAVIGGAVAAITAIYDLIDNTDDIQARNEAKRQKQLEKTQIAIESINRLLDQQARIIDRALGTDRIDAFNRQVKLITSDLVSVIQRINQIDLSRIVDQRGVKRLIEFQTTLQNLAQEAGRPVRGGGAGGTLKTINEVIEANRKEISTLYSLLESGVLDGDTEQLRELLQAYEQLEQQLEEYRNRLKEVVTGTTLISIVDSLADGFKRGYKSAEDFADNFEELMKNAVLQSLKMQALEKPLQQFYDQLAIDSESGGSLDADEIEKLRILYQSIIESAGEQFKQLQELTGLDFSADAAEGNKQGALAGAIKGITADQADVLAGQFNGQRIASLQILEVSRLQLNVQLQQYTAFQQTLDVARQSVNYLEGIEHNTRQTVERLDVTNTRLAATVDRLASMDRKMDSTNDVLRANGL